MRHKEVIKVPVALELTIPQKISALSNALAASKAPRGGRGTFVFKAAAPAVL